LGDDAYELPSGLLMKLHAPVGLGEQSVVSTAPHERAGVEFGSPLPNQNGARWHNLAAKYLDSESLCLGVSAVSRRCRPFLVCHE